LLSEVFMWGVNKKSNAYDDLKNFVFFGTPYWSGEKHIAWARLVGVESPEGARSPQNVQFHNFGIVDSSLCSFCNLHPETLVRLFCSCDYVNKL